MFDFFNFDNPDMGDIGCDNIPNINDGDIPQQDLEYLSNGNMKSFDVDGLSSEHPFQPSFGGNSQIDDLYDPHITSAQKDYLEHVHKITEADSLDDIKYHTEKANEALRSQEFWEDSKFEANIESSKSQIFIDGINEQWDMVNRHQKEMEDIFKHK